MRWLAAACDRLVLAGLVGLIVGTPLAFGAVHAPAYVALEVVAFALVALGAAKVALAGPPAGRRSVVPASLWVPLALFAAVAPLQLLPLPPRVLEALSPATHEVLARSLPGWPERAPYADLAGAEETAPGDLGAVAPRGSSPPAWRILPTPDEASRSPRAASPSGALGSTTRAPGAAQPLSLARARTEAMGLKVAAYAALFLVVLLYPWNGGAAGEARARATLLRCLAITAVAVAALALLQRFTWNGRILWFFVPLDWPSGLPDPRPRVSGPFISRNNLAGYLALLLPLVVVWATVASHLDDRPSFFARRAVRRAGAAAVALAILLSLSRGGWISAAAGLLCLTALLRRLPRGERPPWLRTRSVAAAVATGAVVAIGLALFPLDGDGPNDLDLRLDETVSDSSSLDDRVGYWRAASRLARDFPVLGVGLGAWPEVALRYDPAPLGRGFPREVHSDYLQLVAESGLVGALLVAILAVAVVQRVAARLPLRSPAGLPVAAAALAGMTALAAHAFVDFDLQIPAIPVALAILAATAVRPLLGRAEPRSALRARLSAAAAAGAAVGVAALALAQPALVDPRGAPPAAGTGEAIALVADRPANPLPHLRLYETLGAAPGEARRRELEIALWLAPREPGARDRLAAELARAGDEAAAIAEIEESVHLAPQARDHAYLAPRILPWLGAAERAAVERGLRRALPGHPDAPSTLAAVLAATGRFGEAADVLLAAAEREGRDRERVALRIAAADLLLRAGAPERAEPPLRSALAIAPASTAAWFRLVSAVAAQPAATEEPRAVVERGIAAGADAAELWFALAEAAKRSGAREERRAALERALRARPALAKLHFEMGLLELEEGRSGPAARSLARAAELAPDSAAAWYHLGRAEQTSYHLADARRAFERALAVDPTHAKAREALASLAAARDRVASTR